MQLKRDQKQSKKGLYDQIESNEKWLKMSLNRKECLNKGLEAYKTDKNTPNPKRILTDFHGRIEIL